MTIFQFLDYAGVAVFAATGALAASRKQLDIIGFIFFACLTGVGGGTVRDMLLDRNPVFWIANANFLAVCVATAIFLYWFAPMVDQRYRLLLWLDAAGISAYSVMGAHIGLVAGGSAPIAIGMGILTATFGGILRDTISGEPSVILRKEIYVTAALAGATLYVIMVSANVNPAISACLAVAVAFVIRGGAIQFNWTLPGYRHRIGRVVKQAHQDGQDRNDKV
ncbi:MAG: trimeric intracellular cation channel family protein [Rhizobiaceae bacterium]